MERHDMTSRDALVRCVCARLCDDKRTLDEIRVVDDVLAGLEHGAETIGPLDLEADSRNFDEEAAQECRDLLAYLSMRKVAAQHKAREQLHAEVEAELAAALPICKAPDPARAAEILSALREFRDSARPLYFDDETQIVDTEITAEVEKCR